MSKDESKKTVTVYDVSDSSSREEKPSKLSKYSTKSTMNLCMKEKAGLSAEAFTLMFAAILLVLVIVEYFGIYMPYRKVEARQEEIAAQQAQRDELLNKLSDYEDIQKQYNKYNYDNFDSSITDRQDVLSMLQEKIFTSCTVRRFSVSANTLVLELIDINLSESAELVRSLEADSIVSKVDVRQTSFIDNNGESIPSLSLTITLVNAGRGGN